MRGNTISIELPLKRGKVSKTIPLYQYDYGQKLIITGAELPEYYEVHFSNEMHGDAVTSIGDSTGVLIPDALLATGENVYLWLYLHADSDDGETEFQGAIPVIKRAQVTDQTPTPAEQSVITQAIATLTAASAEATEAKEDAEAAQQHIENMGVASTTLPTGSDATVTKTVNSSGEVTLTFGLPRGVKGDRGDRGLQGETGNDGADGADGFSPVVSLTKSGKTTTFSVTDAEDTYSVEINDGEDGDPTELIDDTAGEGDTNLTWSADKIVEELGAKYEKPGTGIPGTDLASGVLTSIIDDTAGDGDTNKVWSADKSADTASSLLTEIVKGELDDIFAQNVLEYGSAVYDLTYTNRNVNDSTGEQSGESDIRTSTPGLYYVPFECKVYLSNYDSSTHLIQAYCFDKNKEYIAPCYSWDANKALKLSNGTRYVRFYMQNMDNSSITPAEAKSYATLTCVYDGRIEEIQNEVEVLSDKVDPIVVNDNLIIGHAWVDGYYSGAHNDSNSYRYVEKIPVESGKTYKVFPRSRMIYIMSASGSVVNYVSGDNTMQITASGDGFAYVTYYKADDLGQAMFYEQNARYSYPVKYEALGESVFSSPLRGKKWAVLGDSFTDGADSGTLDDGVYKGKKIVYPYIIGNRTGIEVLKFFEGGRTLAYPSDGTFHNSVTDPNQSYYYQNIPADVDYITIYLGINDSHHAPASSGGDGEDNTGEIPIGTASDNTTATYYGAWNVVLTWLRTNRPFAHIGIIVSNGCDTMDYRTAMIEMAKKYGIPYIDLNGDERTPAMIRPQNNDIPSAVMNIIRDAQAVNVAGGNTHPNNNAHKLESTFIENFLLSI